MHVSLILGLDVSPEIPLADLKALATVVEGEIERIFAYGEVYHEGRSISTEYIELVNTKLDI